MKFNLFAAALVFVSAHNASHALANPSAGAAPSPAAESATPAAAATPAAKTAEPTKATATDEMTVEGTIKKVVTKKKEIYVIPSAGGKKLEFYFPADAKYMKNGQEVGFDGLKEGQKVRVTYTKKGKRLNPSKAEILE